MSQDPLKWIWDKATSALREAYKFALILLGIQQISWTRSYFDSLLPPTSIQEPTPLISEKSAPSPPTTPESLAGRPRWRTVVW